MAIELHHLHPSHDDEKRCLNCRHEGKICMRQGWDGDEYWCECKRGMSERDRRSFGCDKWEAK